MIDGGADHGLIGVVALHRPIVDEERVPVDGQDGAGRNAPQRADHEQGCAFHLHGDHAGLLPQLELVTEDVRKEEVRCEDDPFGDGHLGGVGGGGQRGDDPAIGESRERGRNQAHGEALVTNSTCGDHDRSGTDVGLQSAATAGTEEVGHACVGELFEAERGAGCADAMRVDTDP